MHFASSDDRFADELQIKSFDLGGTEVNRQESAVPFGDVNLQTAAVGWNLIHAMAFEVICIISRSIILDLQNLKTSPSSTAWGRESFLFYLKSRDSSNLSI